MIEEVVTRPDLPTLPTALLCLPTFLLAKVGAECKRRSCEVMESEDLQIGHQAILSCLVEFGPTSQRELADRLHYDASDVVALLDELEGRKWLERRPDPEDRRRHAVTVTESGRRAQRRFGRRSQELGDEFLSALDPDERRQLIELLLRVFASFDSRVPESPSGCP